MSIESAFIEASAFIFGNADKNAPKISNGGFAIASSFVGGLVFIMDLIVYTVRGKSFLKLAHSFPYSIWLFILWGVGAGIGGFLGALLQIVKLNTVACVTVGVSWPLILPRLLNAAKDDLAPEQSGQDEEEEP